MLTESSTGLQHSSDNYGESIFSKMIKAGHRTYFLDVKETRNKDYFMTITELRKKTTDKWRRERTQQDFPLSGGF